MPGEPETAPGAAAQPEHDPAQPTEVSNTEPEAGGGDEENDEDETCGFCKFMKGGACRQAFVAWSSCVDKERDAGGDFTEECRERTLALRECMLANKDYYAPLLEEEEEMTREEEQRKQQEGEEQQQPQQGGGEPATAPADQTAAAEAGVEAAAATAEANAPPPATLAGSSKE